MTFKTLARTSLTALAIGAAAVAPAAAQQQAAPTVADAQAFMDRAERQMYEASEFAARIAWLKATYINYDSDWLSAEVGADYTKMVVDLANEAARYDDLDLPPELGRKMNMLKTALVLPAPTTEGAAEELAEITTRLESIYGTGKGTLQGEVKPGYELENLMRTVEDPEQLKEMWASWRRISVPMRDDYTRMVAIANEGARELGYADVGQMWRSVYDMDPDEFAKLADQLWAEVQPLYEDLHCYVRAELNAQYGDEIVPLDQPIRADLLGNMWAQQWGPIYERIAPPGMEPSYDIAQLLKAKNRSDAIQMVKSGEDFFSSLGFEPLPETFWERSMFTKPRDREVVCHASAWNVDNKDDLRIKMCIEGTADDFETIHHELGHNYYQRAYADQSPLYLTGANDGFHEAIGDMVALSITPDYLVQIGLLDADKVPDETKDIGLLLEQALNKVAFLPFGLLVDKWRWQVFSGETPPENYNAAWWDLREQYQGIRPPVERTEADFDPGAKFHIPGNTPYMRYFLAHILQFQFHKAACEQAGWEGPLHRCSIYGNKEVGEKFNAMLKLGASRPWPDALEAFIGEREMSGKALVSYFAPLQAWLKEQNKGRQCGW